MTTSYFSGASANAASPACGELKHSTFASVRFSTSADTSSSTSALSSTSIQCLFSVVSKMFCITPPLFFADYAHRERHQLPASDLNPFQPVCDLTFHAVNLPEATLRER